MALRLGDIVAALGGELHGDADLEIERLAPLASAGPEALTFLSHPKYIKDLSASRAGCVIVSPGMADAAAARGAYIAAADPYLYFAQLTQLWRARHAPPQGPRIHPSAVIDAQAEVASTARIGALCVVERGARIGEHTVLKSRVTVGEDCAIGARGLLHSGVVIGADGFGLAPHAGAWIKIEQLGAVRIGDDVEIGANTCIDRGALDDTVIEDGVKLDNLIQIGHNVHVGRHTAMAGCVGVAGSARIGAGCTLGGGAIVLGHLELADGVHVSAASVVTRSILKPGQYTGMFPLDDNAAWEKNAATLRHLHGLRERIKALEKGLGRAQLAEYIMTTNNTIDIHEILKLLPHRYPFLLLDRVVDMELGKRITALKNVTINEPFFNGHFPHRPVMPGVLILEAMAQAGALLSFKSGHVTPGDDSVYYFAAVDGARFKRPVEPGDQLLVEVEFERSKGGISKFRGKARVGDELACEAELMCAMRRLDR